MITIKLYLKGKRFPITLMFDNQKQVDDFYLKLASLSVVNLGSFAFNTSEYRYSTVKTQNKRK